MEVGVRFGDPKEGMIFWPNHYRAPIKCKIEGKKYFLFTKCEGCGADEVKDYKCAYCKKEI